jgi:hypothetical protein
LRILSVTMDSNLDSAIPKAVEMLRSRGFERIVAHLRLRCIADDCKFRNLTPVGPCIGLGEVASRICLRESWRPNVVIVACRMVDAGYVILQLLFSILQ